MLYSALSDVAPSVVLVQVEFLSDDHFSGQSDIGRAHWDKNENGWLTNLTFISLR